MSTPSNSDEAYLSSQTDVERSDSHWQLPPDNWSYEETVKKVEAIMARIESGELELADVFDQFAAAVEYLRQCEAFLTQRQQQMDLLIEPLTEETDFG